MRLGQRTSLSFSLSATPFGLFSGSTSRMTLFSFTLLFVEFRVLRRLPHPPPDELPPSRLPGR